MKIIYHRFLNHQINPETETLIIGTFNPDTNDNKAEFFYGRSRNYLWRLLPTAYKQEDLKNASKEEKQAFIKKQKIDFIDLISGVKSEQVSKTSFYDGNLDKSDLIWRGVISEIDKLPKLKRVCFTRKTFADIPKMRVQIEAIKDYCDKKGIYFSYLITPARYYREDKQEEWTSFLNKTN